MIRFFTNRKDITSFGIKTIMSAGSSSTSQSVSAATIMQISPPIVSKVVSIKEKDGYAADDNKPFVRMSKAEKKALRRQKAKDARKYKSQKYRHNLAERRKQMDPEERKLQLEQQKKDIIASNARLADSLINGMKVCIDLGFDDEHDSRDIGSLCKQLSLSYSVLKQTPCPVHLHITSLTPGSETQLLLSTQGAENWKVERSPKAPWELFDKSKIVILSPDSENVIESFDKDKVYMIGGIVDRSVRKARTLGKAVTHDIQTARFPIQEVLPERRTHILNIDHALKIICGHLHTNDWHKVLSECVPLRKVRPFSNAAATVAPETEVGVGALAACVNGEDDEEGSESVLEDGGCNDSHDHEDDEDENGHIEGQQQSIGSKRAASLSLEKVEMDLKNST